jgi:hypothetical protein
MMIAEAARLGLLKVRVQHWAGFRHLVADFNGKPISVPLVCPRTTTSTPLRPSPICTDSSGGSR